MSANLSLNNLVVYDRISFEELRKAYPIEKGDWIVSSAKMTRTWMHCMPSPRDQDFYEIRYFSLPIPPFEQWKVLSTDEEKKWFENIILEVENKRNQSLSFPLAGNNCTRWAINQQKK